MEITKYRSVTDSFHINRPIVNSGRTNVIYCRLGLWCLTQLSTIFQLYLGGGNRITRENHRPATSH